MNDTILRKAHMSAVLEIKDLSTRIHRLEASLAVAESMVTYMAARLQMHSRPYKMDTAILSLARIALDAENQEDMNLAIGALKEMMSRAKIFTNEVIKELKPANITHVDQAGIHDELVRKALERIDEKLIAYQQSIMDEIGLSPEDLDDLRRQVEEKFGSPDDFE